MFEDIRYEYSVQACPIDEPDSLELLLNEMSEDGWELYMLHEAESKSGGVQYNCIFHREVDDEVFAESGEIVEVNDFKTRMEKMMQPSDEPYEECKGIQRRIAQIQEEIDRIRKNIDSSAEDIDHKKLNEKMSTYLEELDDLKNEFSESISPDRMYDRINQDRLCIVISDELIDLVDNEKNGDLIAETVKLRQKLTDKLGYVIPGIKFTNSDTLEANEYRIDVRGLKALSGIIYPGYSRFYKGQSNVLRKPKGAIEDIDPVSGRKALWIGESETKNFWEKGLTPAQVITSHLEYIVCKYAAEILEYSDINRYMEIVAVQNLFLLENLIPDSLSVGDIRFILASLIRERVSIKDIIYIFERLNDFADHSDNKDEILQKLRIALNRQISDSISDGSNNIYGITISENLTASLEELFVQENDLVLYIPKHPKINKFIKNTLDIIDNSGYDILNIAVVAQSEHRQQLFYLFEQVIPGLSVMSNQELACGYNLEIIGNLE